MILCTVALVTFSCSKDYLDTAPEASTSPSTIFESTENAQLAINGIAKMMTTQYLSTQGMNGEGTIQSWYGNFTGNDFQKCNQTSYAPLWNSTYQERNTSIYNYYPWYYYYKLIGNANQIIVNLTDENAVVDGTQAEKDFIVAQALTYRAYCFFRLTELYCYRWCDTSNGTSKNAGGIILRTDISTGDWPICTPAEAYAQIYADLDEAIKLYTSSGLDREATHFYEPNLYVAYGIYARAALCREDWSTAATYANKVRTSGKFKLMSDTEYFAGFNAQNDEWMFGVYEAADQTIYYYSFFAYQGSNASSSNCRSYPCAISKELYDQIPEADSRRGLWIAPTDEEMAELNAAGRSTGKLYKRAFKDFGDYLYSTSYVYAYMQVKQRAVFMPGGGSFPIMRLAEMYLIEAEADCHLNKDSEAQTLLATLNAAHNPAYSTSKTGSDLLTEVKLYRRIELWGEGFDWFDHKRWKEPIVRKSFAQGGSWHSSYAITLGVDDANHWTWVTPARETDYNKLAKLTEE